MVSTGVIHGYRVSETQFTEWEGDFVVEETSEGESTSPVASTSAAVASTSGAVASTRAAPSAKKSKIRLVPQDVEPPPKKGRKPCRAEPSDERASKPSSTDKLKYKYRDEEQYWVLSHDRMLSHLEAVCIISFYFGS